jgi:hypothetical protein
MGVAGDADGGELRVVEIFNAKFGNFLDRP